MKLFTSELATMQGENVYVGVYLTTKSDVPKLINYPIKRIIFTGSGGMNQIVTVNQNSNVIMRHIKCLEQIIDNQEPIELTNAWS